MRRLGTGTAVAMAVMLALGVAVTAQDESTPVCVIVDGPVPAEGWDTDALVASILAGGVDITVGDARDCVEPEATLEPAPDEPMPIELVDQGLTAKKDDVNYAVILRNPNPSTWVAQWMPVRVDILDKNDDLVTTEEHNITLLPGQTTAIVGDDYDARGSASLEVAIANGENDWEEIDFAAGDLTFSKMKTKKGRYGATTTGRIESQFQDQVEDVRVTVVYRDEGGNVLGADYTYVDFIPGGGTASFEVDVPDVIPFGKIHSEEVYFQL